MLKHLFRTFLAYFSADFDKFLIGFHRFCLFSIVFHRFWLSSTVFTGFRTFFVCFWIIPKEVGNQKIRIFVSILWQRSREPPTAEATAVKNLTFCCFCEKRICKPCVLGKAVMAFNFGVKSRAYVPRVAGEWDLHSTATLLLVNNLFNTFLNLKNLLLYTK